MYRNVSPSHYPNPKLVSTSCFGEIVVSFIPDPIQAVQRDRQRGSVDGRHSVLKLLDTFLQCPRVDVDRGLGNGAPPLSSYMAFNLSRRAGCR